MRMAFAHHNRDHAPRIVIEFNDSGSIPPAGFNLGEMSTWDLVNTPIAYLLELKAEPVPLLPRT